MRAILAAMAADPTPHAPPDLDALRTRFDRALGSFLAGVRAEMASIAPDALLPVDEVIRLVAAVCYGAQLMAHELGGDVLPAKREYGPATVTITDDDGLFAGLDRDQPVWMSHGDSITRLPAGFRSTAQTDSSPFAGLVDADAQPLRDPVPPRGRPHAGRPRRPAQLRRRDRGRQPDLDAGQLHRRDRRRDPGAGRRARGGDRLGGARHLRAVRRRRLRGRGGARPSRRRRPADLHLRRPRPDAQEGVGAAAGDVRASTSGMRLVMVDAGERFLARLAGVEDPEQKRKIIGDEFIRVFEEEADQARPDRLPGPGHALPGRDRVARRPRPRPPRRSRPTTTSAACRPTCASS